MQPAVDLAPASEQVSAYFELMSCIAAWPGTQLEESRALEGSHATVASLRLYPLVRSVVQSLAGCWTAGCRTCALQWEWVSAAVQYLCQPRAASWQALQLSLGPLHGPRQSDADNDS